MDREFAVRTQVQNRTIVREVDHARQRDLVRTVVGGACVLVTVLFAAWQHLDARRLDKVEAGLSAIATGQLGMKAPTHETSTVIERVTVTPPPSSAVVAQR